MTDKTQRGPSSKLTDTSVTCNAIQPSPVLDGDSLFEHFNSSSAVNSMTKVGLAVLKGSSPGQGPPEKWVEVEMP